MTKEDIIKEYKVDILKLKRDYIKNPLYKKDGFHLSEYPNKDDFIYLFLDCNIRRNDLCILFEVSHSTIDNFIKLFNCRKSRKQANINTRKTILLQYGYDNVTKVKEIRNRQVQTCIRRYGVDNISKLESTKKKKTETTKRNHTTVTSKQEEEIYKLLIDKFTIVKRQHKSKEYPFDCDFYIPELNLYIEYQGTWSHGKEPYDKNNILHQKILKDWEDRLKNKISKNILNSRYKDAIRVWTIRDPLKRQIAKENGLNWIEFFNMDQFMEWYNQILS